MHTSALCCLLLTPTIILPNDCDGQFDPASCSPIFKRLLSRDKPVSDEDVSPKEVFHAFAKLAMGFGSVASGEVPEGITLFAQGVKEFYSLSQKQYHIQGASTPALFAEKAALLPPQEQAALLDGIQAVLEPYYDTIKRYNERT